MNVKLTKRIVDDLAIAATDYMVWDDDIAGFGVRVFPSGRKSYLVQYRARGRTRRRAIGQHGVLTADEARKCVNRHAKLTPYRHPILTTVQRRIWV